MGILKVVCIWCDSLYDCGLIICSFNHLGIIVFSVFYCSFYWVGSKLWEIIVSKLYNQLKLYFLVKSYHRLIYYTGLVR